MLLQFLKVTQNDYKLKNFQLNNVMFVLRELNVTKEQLQNVTCIQTNRNTKLSSANGASSNLMFQQNFVGDKNFSGQRSLYLIYVTWLQFLVYYDVIMAFYLQLASSEKLLPVQTKPLLFAVIKSKRLKLSFK